MGASTDGSTSFSETSSGRRPFSVLFAACLTAAALAACTPSGGGGGGGVSEYDYVDANCSYTNCPSTQQGAPNQSHPYDLIGVDVAHADGFTGAGQLVAVVDNGYRLTHQELAGKNITVFHPGMLPMADHGTSVAALIGGILDGTGMHGVAPGVDLHLSSYQVGATYDAMLAHLAAATNDAALLGAVAQNNSWGFLNSAEEEVTAQELDAFLQSNPSVTQGLAAVVGGSAASWDNYIQALIAFQATGVIVWAVSNDQTMIDADVMSTLPYFELSLQDAWIAVVNGYFEVDSNGVITFAALLSAHCGQYAAEFCIAADGTVWVPGDNSNTYYYSGTGTSFAAPQVAAAVAIMAQAFPALSPEEWADRLLSTADNSWFAAEGVLIEGTTDFGGGVMHDYSIDWGHGVLDLDAALNPIGPLSVLSGDTVTTANRTALNNGIVVTTAGFGDGLQRALAGRDMAVFDVLNGNFTVDAGDLVQSAPFSGLPGLTREIHAVDDSPAAATGTALTNDLAGMIYNGQGLTSQASVLSLARDAAVVRGTADYGRFGISAFGFAADHQAYGDALMSGAGVNASFETALGTFSFGLSQSLERGALLGLVGNDAFNFGAGSSITAAHFGVTREFGPRFSVFGNFEIGVAQAIGAAEGDLVASIEPAGFNGFSVGATLGGVVARNGSLTFSVTQPTRINSGAAMIDMPTERTIDGAITTESVRAEFAPTGRQLDLGLTYALGLGENSQLRFGVQYSLDAGHIDGARGLAAMVGYGINF